MEEAMGMKLKALRKEKGLTMDEVAKKIGVARSTVTKWELGYIENMRTDKVSKLAEVYNVSPLYIIGMTDDKHYAPPRKIELHGELKDLVETYEKLNDGMKARLLAYAQGLLDISM